MFKVVRWSLASASLSLLSFSVHAKKEDGSPVRVDELSLYSVPNFDSKFVKEPRSSLEEGIYRLRTAVESYASMFQAVYNKRKPTGDDGIQQGTGSSNDFQKSPPQILKKLSVIGFSGVLGYFFARPSKLKKLVYPMGFMGITSSFYHPQEACNIAAFFGEKLYDWSLIVFKNLQDTFKVYFQNNINQEKIENWKDSSKQKKK
ncbi:LOW QUALITY PROTEIN: MICOS complex subunit Mic26-like [Antechinus flavipes]|uniref:LOW QUALITY PROTEIN: MICOS complex subunit Mic26-like n=1 Tax=Antechinus flavipes TaxID=38775 RepID=UPI00223647EA|nr:LOW QUALITY PROTEIN: MICOS complex subunit Mic26-like [Antechinus flavipes]